MSEAYKTSKSSKLGSGEIRKADFRRIGRHLWELPQDFDQRMRVPVHVCADEVILEDALRDLSIQQAVNVASLPGVVGRVVVMPDVHEGYGMPIGGVMATAVPDGIVSPGAVGYDINCGVRLLASDLVKGQVEPVVQALAAAIDENCPSGVGSLGRFQLTDRELEEVMREGARWALRRGLAEPEDIRRTEEEGCLKGADPSKVSVKARDRGCGQLGTVGAGNHFVEIGVVEAVFDTDVAERFGLFPDQVTVLIHCGSRGIGHQICTDYLQRFERVVRRYGIELPDRELMCAPLDSEEGRDYLAAMAAAANFAFCNRQVLAHQVRQAFVSVLRPLGASPRLRAVYDIAHNMGKMETHVFEGCERRVCVHRKGATRAWGPGTPGLPEEYRETGQPVLIPGSMGTASFVLAGTSEAMSRTFASACHGAGRVMSRAQAKREVRGERLKGDLEQRGIIVRAGSLAGLAEEAPVAYKDVERVVQTVHEAGIARKVARLRPLAVIKG